MNIKTEIYRRCEIVLHSNKTYENPFMDVDIDAVFTLVLPMAGVETLLSV